MLGELRAAGVAIDNYFRWYGTEARSAGDIILAEAAAYVIRRHKPNLLAIHFVSTDGAQHKYGPHHYLSEAALTMADHAVGILRQAVEEAGIGEQTAFIIAADHGFHSVYREANVLPVFRRAGLLDKLRFHGGGWGVQLELLENFDRREDMPALERALDELERAGIVQRVLRPGEMHAVGLPEYDEDEFVRGHYWLIPGIDLHLAANPGSESAAPEPRRTPYHGHGYLPQHPRMYPALVLSGAGIRRGATIGHTSNLHIAPTVGCLLGFRTPGADGRCLREALEE